MDGDKNDPRELPRGAFPVTSPSERTNEHDQAHGMKMRMKMRELLRHIHTRGARGNRDFFTYWGK